MNYRCAACRPELERCASCRERRATARRAQRRANLVLGRCAECSLDALPDQTRCAHHAEANRARVAAHAGRRVE